MERLITEIHEMEQSHKKKADTEVQHTLALKRDKLKDLIEQETRQVFNRVAKDRYH